MLLRSLAIGLGLCLMQASAHDQYGSSRDSRNNQGWERGRYKQERGREDRSGNRNRFNASVVDRTLADLQRASSRNRVDSHERDHFNRATAELQAFRYRWANGQWDENRLDRAIDDLSDLARADQVNPRDRQMLARDLSMLRQFRSSRGGGDHYSRY